MLICKSGIKKYLEDKKINCFLPYQQKEISRIPCPLLERTEGDKHSSTPVFFVRIHGKGARETRIVIVGLPFLINLLSCQITKADRP